MIADPGLTDCPGLAHAFFTRQGGVSNGLYAARNCGFGSGDDRDAVARNRALCLAELGAGALVTVNQVHSADVVVADTPWAPNDAPRADALVTDRPGIALGILTADCAPVLLADADAGVIGAAHAGWKGALSGVLDATLSAMARLGARIAQIRAVIGPTIGPASYEVGPEFRDRFVAADPATVDLFAAGAGDRLLFDLPGYVLRRLDALGIAQAVSTGHDTLADPDRFFSYRRACHRGEPDYGRLLSAIALKA